MRLMLACSLIVFFAHQSFAQQASSSVRDLTQTLTQGIKDNQDLKLKLDLGDDAYWKNLLEALAGIETNTLQTTTDLMLAVQSLETIYRQSVDATSDHLDKIATHLDGDKVLWEQAEIIREKLDECNDDPTCVADIDGLKFTYEELIAMFSTLQKIASESYVTHAKALKVFVKTATKHYPQIRARVTEQLALKRVRLREEIQKNPDMSPEEREFQIQTWNNYVLRAKLIDVQQVVLNESKIKAENDRLEARLKNDPALQDLRKRAHMQCRFGDKACKNERKRARKEVEKIEKELGLTNGGAS